MESKNGKRSLKTLKWSRVRYANLLAYNNITFKLKKKWIKRRKHNQVININYSITWQLLIHFFFAFPQSSSSSSWLGRWTNAVDIGRVCLPGALSCDMWIWFRPPWSTARNMKIRRVAFSWTCVQVNLFPDYCVIEFPHILVEFSCFRNAKLVGDRNWELHGGRNQDNCACDFYGVWCGMR